MGKTRSAKRDATLPQNDSALAANRVRNFFPAALLVYRRLRFQMSDDIARELVALIGKYILANDNNMCGGMNVRFWGIWKRARK